MASSKQDFERFMTWLHPPELRRLANLALAHFDELAHTSRQYSQRSIHLVRRARRSLAQTPDAPPDILSEGHIRCLGLAILLAKSQSVQSPLIVFDDAINAIDHDHRGGIRETIFESDHFTQTQLIVTCHSNEFIKDIQQHLPAQRRNDCQVYLFRNHDGNYQPRVTGNVPSRNYVVKARASKNALDDREALASARQALEMLSEKTWRSLASHGLGVLNLQLAGVGAEPGLRDLCNALRKRLNDATTFAHANKPLLIAAYDRILGIPDANLVWTYLNKGTQDLRPECREFGRMRLSTKVYW